MAHATKPFELNEIETICTIASTVTVPEGKLGFWHVFSNETDEYYGLEEEDKARAQFDEWVREYGCARLYLQVEDSNGDTELEECWEAVGDYPM